MTVSFVDDGDAGCTLTGSWTGWTLGGYGGDYRYSNATGTVHAVYQDTGLTGGIEVALTWENHPNRHDNVKVEIFDGSTDPVDLVATEYIDQEVAPTADYTAGGVDFQIVGTYSFSIYPVVKIHGGYGGSSGYVIADCCRFEDGKTVGSSAVNGVFDVGGVFYSQVFRWV